MFDCRFCLRHILFHSKLCLQSLKTRQSAWPCRWRADNQKKGVSSRCVYVWGVNSAVTELADWLIDVAANFWTRGSVSNKAFPKVWSWIFCCCCLTPQKISLLVHINWLAPCHHSVKTRTLFKQSTSKQNFHQRWLKTALYSFQTALQGFVRVDDPKSIWDQTFRQGFAWLVIVSHVC